ncbi:hypothetical protein PBY51_008479 [Eleginops maclovinus]|uniref:MADF domain-containing protein n=1 Tax=Eleginops maclovinus TaxID=56733 RepID=A0AAN7ZW25_ELEMC|nr:hypothetical protein PBY51_008479 [Eleginops maclovinus]
MAGTSLLDVASQSYHDRNNRDKSWMAIATQLQLPVNEVKTRVASLRTQFGKLIKPKPSGSGQKTLTPKQQWILQHLDFLRVHVAHRSTESTLRPGSESEDTSITEEGEEDQTTVDIDADVEDVTSNISSPLSEPTENPSPPVKVSSGQSSKRPRVQKSNSKFDEHNLEMAKLFVLQQVQKTLSGSDADSEERFGQQVASELRNLTNPAVQLRVRRNIMNLIYDAQETAISQQGSVPGNLYGSQAQFPGTQVRPPLYPMLHPYQVQSAPQSHQATTQPMSFLSMLNTSQD